MLPASAVMLISPTQMTATFAAGAVPPGVYTVRAARADGASSQVAGALTIVPDGQGVLTTNLIVPDRLYFRALPAEIDIEYSNTGDDAMPAPLLILTATQDGNQAAFLTLDPTLIQSGTWNAADPDGYTNSIQLLASGVTPGLLQPGESIRVPVYWGGWLESEWDFNSPVVFQLDVAQTDDQAPSVTAGPQAQSSTGASSGGSGGGGPIPWDQLEAQLRPPTIAPDAWDALFPNLVAQLGSTWDSYLSRLDADAVYLGSLPGQPSTSIGSLSVEVDTGSNTAQASFTSSGTTAGSGFEAADPDLLLGFEVELANGLSPVTTLSSITDATVSAPGLPLDISRVFSNSITSRYQLGPFGRGWWWSDGWQRTLSVLDDGTVVIADGNGSQRRFQPDSRGGGYIDDPGDHGILTILGAGSYALTETDGTVTAFRADGKIDYVQDTNGNRITAGYTSGLLTSLTDSSGQSLQIAYNSAGRITSITDPASGQSATYTYDASNQHLLTATDLEGLTTTYTYDTGANPATANALLSVTSPSGTHQYFTYDTEGRLADIYDDGEAQKVTYTYGPTGDVSATDADGGTTTYSFDVNGLVAKVEDPLQHVTLYSYDTNFNLVQVTDPAGNFYKFSYDSMGDLISQTDPLEHTEGFGYTGPFNRLTSATDQDGNTTQYGYDQNGNETSTTYADGSVEQYAYDALGDPQTLTNRRGDPITYQYDTSGRIDSATFVDGTQMTYHYDSDGNLKSTTDPTGTTTLTYYPNNELEQITYPDGTLLRYSYDAGGRRTQMVDQTGFTVNYTYDAAGRLATLADGTGALIDQYTYDAAGRLKREDKGNGTYTTYEYDLAGDVLHLVNYAPDGTVNSRFDYTYDDLGRVATETTLDGEWTYSYDAIGELTHAVFASNNPSALPNQDLQYVYDPAGNRTQTIINGVATDYVSNNVNEYTSIGNENLTYDPDGNLVSTTDGSQTSAYTYNDADQLVSASTTNGSLTAQYDALGFRVATGMNGETTDYVVDPTGLNNVVGMYGAAAG